ncbi:AAA family ATPase [Planctomycetota bacterium]
MGQAIRKLTIKGYKSIRNLEDFELRNLNILIGPNGAGKSNFLSFFELLKATLSEDKEKEISRFGSANRFFYMGSKITKTCEFKVHFSGGVTGFKQSINLTANPEDELIILNPQRPGMFSGEKTGAQDDMRYLDDAQKHIQKNIRLYHFHDTSTLADVRKYCSIRDYEYLRVDASNLAAFLWYLKKKQEKEYQLIREVVQLAASFFDDFLLRESIKNPDETLLEWRQKGSDYPFHPSQISDGTLRFICLATALLQPNPPSIILLDEPELGLHPYALAILAGLIQKASIRTQVIVSTQSAALIDHFKPEDIILVERKNNESVFDHPNTERLKIWLEDYSLGDIWSRNILEGTAGQ